VSRILYRDAQVQADGLGGAPGLVDLLCAGGRVLKLARGLDPGQADAVVELGGLWVLPGAMDPHVHFDTPGFEAREDFAHGSRGALKGGVTCVIDMPCTSLPPVVDAGALGHKLEAVGSQAWCDFALFGGVDARRVAGRDPGWRADLAALAGQGVVACKCYTVSGMETYPALDDAGLREVMQAARELGFPVALHAEAPDVVLPLTARAQREGRVGPQDYADSRPPQAEVLAVERALAARRDTRCALHVVHLASGQAAALVARARARGEDASGETCPHYLAFTREDLARQGALLKTAPVVKSANDREELWQLLLSGGLDFAATDHAPCRYPQDKDTGDIWTAYGGVPGVELLLPFLLSEGYHHRGMGIHRLVEVTSGNAARRYGLFPRKGALVPGSDADFAVLDPGREWTVRGEALESKGKFTPFEGHTFRGKVVRTVLRGETAWEEGAGFAGEPRGEWIRRVVRSASAR
jgi:allantoinase